MDKEFYINNIEDLSPQQIAEGIADGVVSFQELRNTGDFGYEKQKAVKNILQKKDDEVFFNANSKEDFEKYLSAFPAGVHASEAQYKIEQMNREEMEKREREEREEAEKREKEYQQQESLNEIRKNINGYTPNEIINNLSSDDLDELCSEMGINSELVRNYRSPILNYNDIPEQESDVPNGYTDVFFWGIPSSGKTSALAAILSTMNKNYVVESPDTEKQFGTVYKDCLTNIFNQELGFLPSAGTHADRTQYMPFLLSKRGEKSKRKISFFELSGEVFNSFYDKVNNTNTVRQDIKEEIEKAFKTIELLLKSDNQKIHFFLIDYNREQNKRAGDNSLTQANYLSAAATYFRNNNNILKRKTDAVYIVVTKSDEIEGNDKIGEATRFLQNKFGNFINVIQNQCNDFNVNFDVKLFSIGDIYFKLICNVNRSYSEKIIEELIYRIKPENKSWFKRILES